MKYHNLSFKSFLATAAVLLAVLTAVLPGRAGASSPLRSMDTDAARAKARAMADLAATTSSTAPWMSRIIAERAARLWPGDTTIMLVVNDRRLMSEGRSENDYKAQLDIVTKKYDTPVEYYTTVVILSKLYEKDDSLAMFRLARMASERNPKLTGLANLTANEGVEYLGKARFKYKSEDADPDTMALSSDQLRFARDLIAFADSSIALNGFSPALDMAKAKTYFLMGDTVSMRTLADDMLRRDPNDIEVLTNLTNVYLELGDSAKVTELGLRNFELDPDPQYVYGLFNAIKNEADRSRLTRAVFKTAANPDIESSLRVNLLNALTQAVYEQSENATGDSLINAQVNAIATELIAEEPDDINTVLGLSVLGHQPGWLTEYGYRYLTDYATAFPDSIDNIQPMVGMLSGYAPLDDAVVNVLSDYKSRSTLDHPLETDLAIATLYMNNDRDDKALKILEPITMTQIREMVEFQIKQLKENKSSDKEADFDDDDIDADKRTTEQWVLLKSIISEAQERLGRDTDAIESLRSIVTIDPENALALNNLAYFSATHGGDLNEALIMANRSLELAPENPNTIDTRAWINFLMGNTGQAYDDMVRFFDTLKLSMDIILKNPDGHDSVVPFTDYLVENNINKDAVAPILGHLLLIFEKLGDEYSTAALRTQLTLDELDPDNEDLLQYNKRHPLDKETDDTDDSTNK